MVILSRTESASMRRKIQSSRGRSWDWQIAHHLDERNESDQLPAGDGAAGDWARSVATGIAPPGTAGFTFSPQWENFTISPLAFFPDPLEITASTGSPAPFDARKRTPRDSPAGPFPATAITGFPDTLVVFSFTKVPVGVTLLRTDGSDTSER